MIAIYNRKESFSDRWIAYCEHNQIDFITINIYDSNIINYLIVNNVKILIAHPQFEDFRTRLISKSILLSIEKKGIIVFPNFNSYWHFDDKISQKYLFESLNIPHSPIHLFYNRDDASKWLSNAEFPLVFKLRTGAGSANVHLLKNQKEANSFLAKMFSGGISPMPSITNDFRTKVNKHRGKRDWKETIKRLPSTIHNIMHQNTGIPPEMNYFYAQDFLPGNTFDTRVTIIGEKAFAFRRFNRPDSFKASGSGNIDYSHIEIDKRCILLAFQAAEKLGSQSMAFDILYNKANEPVIIEMSYIYVAEALYKTGGYWDVNLAFHDKPLWPEEVIIENLLELAE